MPIRKLIELTPAEFENLAYDVLQRSGFHSIVWRTPGADGGRDIEARYSLVDASGQQCAQKWYVECKRYSSSIDWPTVFGKLSYAQNNGADFLLMISTNNPSPNCETEIARWNETNNLKIRFWRGYQIEGLLRNHPNISIKYGLSDPIGAAAVSLHNLAFIGMKFSQAAHSSYVAGRLSESALAAAAAVGELVVQRTLEIERRGRAVFDRNLWESDDWVIVDSIETSWDRIGLYAYLTAFRHFSGAKTLKAEAEGTGVTLTADSPRLEIGPKGFDDLSEIALWANIEQCDRTPASVRIFAREDS